MSLASRCACLAGGCFVQGVLACKTSDKTKRMWFCFGQFWTILDSFGGAYICFKRNCMRLLN